MYSKKKNPSYLSEVKDELLKLIIADHASNEQEAQEITDNLWKFVCKKITKSYWNGVAAGASGKVKPKTWPAKPKAEG